MGTFRGAVPWDVPTPFSLFQAAPEAGITSCAHFAVTRITALKAESALDLTLLTALTL